MLADTHYRHQVFKLSEIEHRYGLQVHLLSDPFLHSHLAKLCASETHQPVINELVSTLYSQLLTLVVNQEFPRTTQITETRMAHAHSEAKFESDVVDPQTKVVSVNLARAGTLPSHICYTALNYFMNPKNIRQDHLSIARQTGEQNQVTGSVISGHKIGGSVDDSIVLIPDPMGATGSTLIETLDLFKKRGRAKKYIALHCIVTPEYLARVTKAHPDLIIFAIRLDRGLSPKNILSTIPGTYWDQEKGLNDEDYIVPGGGGFGEILNNAYV